MEGCFHGPVVSKVFRTYKSFEYNPIDITYGNIILDPDERNNKAIDKQDIANYFINEVFEPGIEK